MKFSITNRKLMNMLFELGTVTEMSGICKVGNYERRWEVVLHPATPFGDAPHFTGTVYGIYNEYAESETLDEVLNKIEKIIEGAAV